MARRCCPHARRRCHANPAAPACSLPLRLHGTALAIDQAIARTLLISFPRDRPWRAGLTAPGVFVSGKPPGDRGGNTLLSPCSVRSRVDYGSTAVSPSGRHLTRPTPSYDLRRCPPYMAAVLGGDRQPRHDRSVIGTGAAGGRRLTKNEYTVGTFTRCPRRVSPTVSRTLSSCRSSQGIAMGKGCGAERGVKGAEGVVSVSLRLSFRR